jgi:hypothetical protein
MSEAVLDGNSTATSSGPTTFEEAFAADVSSTSDPASASTEAQQPAASAETQAATGQPAGDLDERSPYIPRARFDEINTKLKEAQQWRESRAWAEQVDAPAFQQMTSWFLRAQTDPRGFALGLLDEMTQHPEHAQAIRSELARRLGTRQTSSAPAADTMPEPDVAITDANGTVVGRTYSAEQLAKRDAFLQGQWMSQVEGKIAPHLQTLKSIEQERQDLANARQAESFGASFAQELAGLPLFNELKKDIAAELSKLQVPDDPNAVRIATYQVYHRLVAPKLSNGAQQTVLADLQRKAKASTGVNPGTASSTLPKGVSSFYDKSLDWGG